MKKDERISFYSHLVGFFLALIGMIILLIKAFDSLDKLIIAAVYGLSVVFLFLASSLYHAHKKVDDENSIWRKLDHFAIFVMIAGSYTPVAYLYLEGWLKWTIIAVQWGLVLGGFFLKFMYFKTPRILYTVIYLLMGWVGIFAFHQLFMTMPTLNLILMFAGGLSFTAGAVFYIIKKPDITPNFGFHEIFHFFILAGGILHYLMVFIALG
ncbi:MULTISPECIES: hemolysin III family protein [unclassified Halanaerobium]|uniref:PAQR family membrane homeostasis protein TrhA n=1 Tax=unclassified Halanaerobium TaxID=2641197 RepID=UPI000DF4C492|nr:MULTISPECIES: hemolysin III family protein [unclassified Halanaerobium]RCW47765.1 hemolysin III [Halanaerobium sp. MA284_MarDTE_T2]RCW81798.1 hemolysin III [Halanaerobium sp. DL-01]